MEVKTADLEALSDHDHGHVPYLLLLLRFLEDWKKSHNGNPPSDYKEKKEFKGLIESKARTKNAEGGEENFDEAAAAVLKSLNRPSLPSGLSQIFEQSKTRDSHTDTANFWLIASAIQLFYTTFDCLPLPGALPDMKAQSHDYIQLQNIYKTKSRQDIDEITKRIRAMEGILDRELPVAAKEIEAFCKGAAFVRLIKGRQLLTHINTLPTARVKEMSGMLMAEDSLLPIYIAFLAYDAMSEEYIASQAQKLPQPEHRQELSLGSLKLHAETVVSTILAAAASENESNDQDLKAEILGRVEPILEELIRADGAELHNISALTGGMVAQEVIKVITKQYIPVDNTCVFDGIASKSDVFRI